MARYNYRRTSGTGYDSDYNKNVRAIWVPQVNAYKVNFPFNQNLIDLIKTKVPVAERSYDPQEKTWFFSETYFDLFLPLIKSIWPSAQYHIIDKSTVDSYNQGQASAQAVAPEKLAEEFYRMIEKAGLQVEHSNTVLSVVRKLYLRAAKYYHPDYNPERAKEMSRLNELWSSLTTSGSGAEAFFK